MKNLRIGLLGPPHANKDEIIRIFRGLAPEEWGHIAYVENPGPLLQEEYDIAMGSFGGWREDLLAVVGMMMTERESEVEGDSYITSGSLLSPLAHAVANLETVQQGLQTQLTQGEIMARQYTLAVITMLVLEYAHYNFIFRIPQPLEQPEGSDDFEWYYRSKVERAITPTLEQLNLDRRFQLLKPGTPEELATEMVETIKSLYDRVPDDDETTEISEDREGAGSGAAQEDRAASGEESPDTGVQE